MVGKKHNHLVYVASSVRKKRHSAQQEERVVKKGKSMVARVAQDRSGGERVAEPSLGIVVR